MGWRLLFPSQQILAFCSYEPLIFFMCQDFIDKLVWKPDDGIDMSHIVNSQDRRLRMISRGGVVRRLILESRLKFKPWFSFRDMWHHQVHFEVESGFPQTTLSCP
jgi:hypothetical protein